jgi:hypothetical protein
MSVTAVVFTVADVVVRLTDEAPKDEDVKAGWTALVIFLLLIGAVVVLGFSLTKQLRKAQAAKDAGVFGDEPPGPDPDGDPSEPSEPSEPSAPENHSSSS